MKKYRVVAQMLVLLFFFFSPLASAYWDTPYVTPADAMPSDALFVNVRGGGCDTLSVMDGYPQVSQQGSSIRIIFSGEHYTDSELCVFPVGAGAFPFGAYPAGEYTLQVDVAYEDFSGPQIFSMGTVPFTVEGTTPPALPPTPVPTSGLSGLLALALILMVLAIWSLRGRRVHLALIGVALASFGARAQVPPPNLTIEILITNAPGAPTPEQIVNFYSPGAPRNGSPPLHAFAVKSPQSVSYLATHRASGDFLTWLQTNPNSARAKIERYVVATFSSREDVATALTALGDDPYVEVAYEPLLMQPSGVTLTHFGIDPDPPGDPLDGIGQYGRDALNIDAAWSLASGYALIAVIDMGIYQAHPALQQFSGTIFTGGNFIKAASQDISYTGSSEPTGFDATNVDEEKPLPAGNPPCSSTAPVAPTLAVGHGTHVSGLVGANGASGQGVQGTCKHCGIALWKVGRPTCDPLLVSVYLAFNTSASSIGITDAVDAGAQVTSISFGLASGSVANYCQSKPSISLCLGISHATARAVTLVAAAGNNRTDLQIPASDARVVSVGGFETMTSGLAPWDESPGTPINYVHCPVATNLPLGNECGSNYTTLHNGLYYFTHQELAASAQSVLSTTYPHINYEDYAHCGDGYPSQWGNGVGLCTGTSMAAPQIAGVVGILRSINPLVSPGVPEPAAGVPLGVRAVLAKTTDRAQAVPPQGWDPHFGYGIPDAAAAARKVLGKIAGATIRNRATPLFRLYNSVAKDFADTSSPQYALSLMINQTHNYVQYTTTPPVPPVPGYTFPYDPATEAAPATPTAPVYVLTTEFSPRNPSPALIPLYLMDKPKANGTDYLLATPIDMGAIHTGGYNLRTIQGYIYQPCTPEKTCIPTGAKRFYRGCKTTDNDCAAFLETESAQFASYNVPYPPGSNMLLGYAYPAGDSDGDGLPDAFEYVVGTNPNSADSDGDGSSDATEFPMIGIPVNDPCMGGTLGAKNCAADHIFKNGFESL